jgi:hypothetical protein
MRPVLWHPNSEADVLDISVNVSEERLYLKVHTGVREQTVKVLIIIAILHQPSVLFLPSWRSQEKSP